MTDYKQKLSDIAKSEGVVVIAKTILADGKTYGINEHEFTSLVIETAKRRHPDLASDQAFEKLFMAQTEEGETIRKAYVAVKSAPLQDDDAEAKKDSAEAIRELQKIGDQKWPGLSRAQRFARAFETNIDLAKRAHRRPLATSTSYPFPRS